MKRTIDTLTQLRSTTSAARELLRQVRGLPEFIAAVARQSRPESQPFERNRWRLGRHLASYKKDGSCA